MDHSRLSVTTYLNDEQTHAKINKKLFKGITQPIHQINEVKLVKSETEHKDSTIVDLFH